MRLSAGKPLWTASDSTFLYSKLVYTNRITFQWVQSCDFCRSSCTGKLCWLHPILSYNLGPHGYLQVSTMCSDSDTSRRKTWLALCPVRYTIHPHLLKFSWTFLLQPIEQVSSNSTKCQLLKYRHLNKGIWWISHCLVRHLKKCCPERFPLAVTPYYKVKGRKLRLLLSLWRCNMLKKLVIP